MLNLLMQRKKKLIAAFDLVQQLHTTCHQEDTPCANTCHRIMYGTAARTKPKTCPMHHHSL